MVADRARPGTREVICTHCDRPIEIPESAMSVNCRHCHRRVIIEDMKIKAYHAVVRLATAGKVEVAKNAQVVAEVRVNELIVHGTVKGAVTAMERVVVGKRGTIYGDVACRSIQVQAGARLEGHFRVEPDVSPVHEGALEGPENS
jgi:DNA-directed RNA polymerase subunit RPC12/RpoP